MHYRVIIGKYEGSTLMSTSRHEFPADSDKEAVEIVRKKHDAPVYRRLGYRVELLVRINRPEEVTQIEWRQPAA